MRHILGRPMGRTTLLSASTMSVLAIASSEEASVLTLELRHVPRLRWVVLNMILVIIGRHSTPCSWV